MVEVTQADEIAAAEFMNSHGWLCEEEWAFLYENDKRVIIKAFARHREAAEASLRAENAELKAENAKLREALHDAICMIGHAMLMDTTILAGRRMVASEVWKDGYALLHPRAALAGGQPALKGDSND